MINIDSRLLFNLDASEFLLLSYLTSKVNGDRVCWYGNKTICKELKWSMVRLQATKKRLMEKGLLEVERRFKENSPAQTSNYYKILTPLASNYTPTLKLGRGDTSELDRGDASKLGTAPVSFSGKAPTSKLGNEVLISEALETEVLTTEELKKENNIHLSYKLHKIFETIISCLYPQFEDYHFNRWEDDQNLVTDPTTLNLIKKIRGAAAAIHSAYEQLNKPIPKWRDYSHSWSRDEGEPDAGQDGVDQVESYVEWCRVTKTWVTKDPDKLAEKILQEDWCLRLKQWADERFPHEYDPMANFGEGPQWILEYFYEQQMVWVDKRNENRIF